MPKELIFFCCACCVLFLTIINLSVGPITSISESSEWGNFQCAYYQDKYDIDKKSTARGNSDKLNKYSYEWQINECKNKKALHDMEYTAFIFDIVIGFICSLLGLLQLYGIKKEFLNKAGLTGFICGIVGFILTFIYIVFNGIVFTNYNILGYDKMKNGNFDELYKRDSDGVYAEWDEAKKQYKCIYNDFDEPLNIFALYAKFSDLIGKQYNYDKDYFYESKDEVKKCQKTQECSGGYINNPDNPLNKISYLLDDGSTKECDKLYISGEDNSINKDYFDRFLTTLLLSLIVCIAHIGLIIFGFLLFKGTGDDSTKVIKVENVNSNA